MRKIKYEAEYGSNIKLQNIINEREGQFVFCLELQRSIKDELIRKTLNLKIKDNKKYFYVGCIKNRGKGTAVNITLFYTKIENAKNIIPAKKTIDFNQLHVVKENVIHKFTSEESIIWGISKAEIEFLIENDETERALGILFVFVDIYSKNKKYKFYELKVEKSRICKTYLDNIIETNKTGLYPVFDEILIDPERLYLGICDNYDYENIILPKC